MCCGSRIAAVGEFRLRKNHKPLRFKPAAAFRFRGSRALGTRASKALRGVRLPGSAPECMGRASTPSYMLRARAQHLTRQSQLPIARSREASGLFYFNHRTSREALEGQLCLKTIKPNQSAGVLARALGVRLGLPRRRRVRLQTRQLLLESRRLK